MLSKDELMNNLAAEQDKPSSALALVGLGGPGIPGYGPDLLDDALSGELGAPSAHPSFKKRADFGTLNEEMKAGLAQDPDEDEEPEEPEAKAPKAKEPEELPSYYHSLNESVTQTRERVDQQMQAQQQRTDALIQELRRQQQPQQAPAPEDKLYEAFGLEDAAPLSALEQRIMQRVYQQAVYPMAAQNEQARFEAELARAEKDHEHFGKYFDKEHLRGVFNHVIRSRPLQESMKINWSQELKQAYSSADGPRKDAELTRLQKEIDELKAGKESGKEKQKDKSKLALVPKSSHQGSPAKTGRKELDELDKKLSFQHFGREIWKRIGS